MKKIVFLVFFIFLLIGPINAQIVLNPADVYGSVEKENQDVRHVYYQPESCFCNMAYGTLSNHWSNFNYSAVMGVKHYITQYFVGTYTHYIDCPSGAPCGPSAREWYLDIVDLQKDRQAIFEFDISSLTGLGVTIDNYVSAELNNLQIESCSSPGDSAEVSLFNLGDTSEDGVVDINDYSNFPFTPITVLFNQVPPVGTVFNNIDVTDEVYNDLFVTGSIGDFSGFVLYQSGQNSNVVFECNPISLTITIDSQDVPALSPVSIMLLGIVFSGYAIIRLRTRRST